MQTFSGVIVPMITPFREDLSLDLEGVRWLVSFLSEKGVHGIFVNSTTGEFVHLRREEAIQLTKTSIEAAKGPKIIPGISANFTEESVELGRKMKDLGADGAVITPPFFFSLRDDWLFDHFARVAGAVDLPLIIYNIPSLTGNDIPVAVYAKLAEEFSNVVAAKVTKDSVAYIRRLIGEVKSVRRDFSVLTGMDDHLLNTLALGGDGGIMALANVAPQIHLEVYDSWMDGRYGDAVEAFRRLAKLTKIYDMASSFPTSVKTSLSVLGAPIKEICRTPLGRESEEVRRSIRSLLEELGVRI